MALIKWGMMVVDGSGKLGGHVLSKNRGGSYARTKVTPTNPRTSYQTNVRGVFATISSGWSSLTDAERASWNNSVAAYATTNIFGDLKNPSGKALYQKINQNLIISGQFAVTVCPQPIEVPYLAVSSAVGDASSGTMTITTTGDGTGTVTLVYATPILSQGTSFVKNRLRLIAALPGATDETFNVGSEYVAKFGAMSAGANIKYELVVVNANGGRAFVAAGDVTVAA